MAETTNLEPIPQGATSAPQASDTAEQIPAGATSAPPPSAQNPQVEPIPAGASPVPAAPLEPIPSNAVNANDHGVLSFLKKNVEEPLEQTFASEGTIGKQIYDDVKSGSLFNGPNGPAWASRGAKTPEGAPQSQESELSKLSDKSLWKTQNAISDEEKEKHPYFAAFDEGISKSLDALGTPANLAMLVATYGTEPLIGALEQGLKAAGLAEKAPAILNGAKLSRKISR